jgi:hypothetical protein
MDEGVITAYSAADVSIVPGLFNSAVDIFSDNSYDEIKLKF